jgi:hypothetical protein
MDHPINEQFDRLHAVQLTIHLPIQMSIQMSIQAFITLVTRQAYQVLLTNHSTPEAGSIFAPEMGENA